MVVADGQGIPLGVSIASASPAAVRLVEQALRTVSVPRKRGGRPRTNMECLLADRAYDADWLRITLWSRGIQLICPHRRWKIERTIAWIGNYRRLLIRRERNDRIFLTFMHVACLLITTRQL